ncbi:hypothetical protein [Streptomyces sp.]|uniref:hypothetical protein n=1 Tax=Streptomyces sp. TaxID=1931 RepID=UPI002811BCEC|nr:hypothetical protein [Streptomyces sp.]
MARLQILELPEGGSDDRPPFILVIDQVDDDLAQDIASWPENIAKRTGARQVLCFSCTIDIPANDTTAYLPEVEAQAEPRRDDERAIQAEEKLKAFMKKRYVIEQEHKALLTDALGMDRLRDWDDIRNAAAGLRQERDAQAAAIERVRNKPTKPEVMNAQQEHPTVWMHGYHCGVLAARGALAPRNEPTAKSTDA